MDPEQLVASRLAFEGKLIQVRVDTVRLPGGGERTREVVEHPGAVGILPVLPDGTIVLVRQYRHAIGKSLLEIPAGTREPGESEEACALRELREETGLDAREVRELVRFYVSPGWANEELVVFLAQDLTEGTATPADDERLDVVRVQPDQVPHLIARGEIGDAKTITGLLAYLGVPLVR